MKKRRQSARKSALAKERLRQSFRPDHIRVLFVGEAPPASGRFFYQADSGLYCALRDTFVRAFPTLRKEDFLKSFCGLGCYLVDLCGTPVDHLDRKSRRKVCKDSEVRLSQIFKKYRPDVVITLVRSIEPNVRRAKQLANWEGRALELPYPGRWYQHRRVFERKLIRFLAGSRKIGPLGVAPMGALVESNMEMAGLNPLPDTNHSQSTPLLFFRRARIHGHTLRKKRIH